MNGLMKKLFIFLVVMGAVAAAGWFGRRAYKRGTEYRLVTDASRYLKASDFRNAELCLRRALQVNPLSLRGTRMVAEMLETAGVPSALGWRMRAAQLQPANMDYRLEWAETALKVGEVKSAEDALGGVSGNAKTSAAYDKLAGAVAWSKHNLEAAEKNYLEALRLEPTNLAIVLNLATIHLGSTNRETADAARASLEQLATNAACRLNSLHDLQQDAIARKSLVDALKFSKQLATGPSARFGDKIDYLQLLMVSTNADFGPWFASLKLQATNSAAQTFALGRWIAMSEGPSKALVWMESLPGELRTNQPVPLILTDCKIMLKDWTGLLTVVEKQDWAEANFYRLALESLAQRSLGKEVASQAAWRNSLHASLHRLDRLSRLAQATSGWGWKPENTEVLREITAEFPKEKWAANSLMAQLYAAGNTRELTDFLSKMYAEDPTDVRVKNNLANLCLLRKSDLERAFRLAKEAYTTAPTDPFFSSTYAYSLLLQKKPDEALKILGDLNPKYLQIPSIAAYYGVVQAESGHKDLAKEPLQRAQSAKLLPEEKDLVHLAMARL
jgi:tetratricopeptide (TPR) repeat protein